MSEWQSPFIAVDDPVKWGKSEVLEDVAGSGLKSRTGRPFDPKLVLTLLQTHYQMTAQN